MSRIIEINACGLDASTLVFLGGDEDGKSATRLRQSFVFDLDPWTEVRVQIKKTRWRTLARGGPPWLTASAYHEPMEQKKTRRRAFALHGPPWLSLIDPSRADETTHISAIVF